MHNKLLQRILKLIADRGLVPQSNIIPLNKTITEAYQILVRPAINYGSRTDYTYIRKTEDFIITLQFFTQPGDYVNLSETIKLIRDTIQKQCDTIILDQSIYSLLYTQVTGNQQPTLASMNLNLMFNCKETL